MTGPPPDTRPPDVRDLQAQLNALRAYVAHLFLYRHAPHLQVSYDDWLGAQTPNITDTKPAPRPAPVPDPP